jgi:hypothetical protein
MLLFEQNQVLSAAIVLGNDDQTGILAEQHLITIILIACFFIKLVNELERF